MSISRGEQAAKRYNFVRRSLLGHSKKTAEEVQGTNNQVEEVMEIRPSTADLYTQTVEDREEVIQACLDLYESDSLNGNKLNKPIQKLYLEYAFKTPLPPQFKALDASQPWLLYWIGNSMKIMEPSWFTDDYGKRIMDKLWNISPQGGPFGGGKGQLPHLTANYAAINAIALASHLEDEKEINKSSIHRWLFSLKTVDGGFKTTSPVGEHDVRGVYAALSVASLLGILDDDIKSGVLEFLIKCQSYEGGFGGCPYGDEAHGGYTFCAVASLAILGELERIEITSLMKWCSERQYREEKGLSGRTNKLVDGCYSFWVGGTAAILEAYGYGTCIDKSALKQYILRCCQSDSTPGLRDKPGKNPDYYHTNYVAAGLSICEYSFKSPSRSPFDIVATPLDSRTNVQPINPIYGLTLSDVHNFILKYSDVS